MYFMCFFPFEGSTFSLYPPAPSLCGFISTIYRDWEYQSCELIVLTRSLLLFQHLHRIYTSYMTHWFWYVTGTMWIKLIISSNILEVLSLSVIVTKLILACAKCIPSYCHALSDPSQPIAANPCSFLQLSLGGSAHSSRGPRECRTGKHSQLWSMNFLVFLFSLISAGRLLLLLFPQPHHCCHIPQHTCLEESGHCEELMAADLSLLHEDQKQKKQLEMLSRWCQVWAPQMHSSQLCQPPALSLVSLTKCILRFPDRSTVMGFGVIKSAPTIFGSFENQLEVVPEINKALPHAPAPRQNNWQE